MENFFYNIMHQLTYIKGEPMLFSSGVFWALFLVFLPAYAFVKRRTWQMIIFVLAFSFFFYYKSSGLFVFLLFATSWIDWTLSKILVRMHNRADRIACVVLSLVCSLGVLGYFKYANFFMWNWSAMVGSNFAPMDIVLPVGISFYTFQSVSYIIDVYKGRIQPCKTWLEYAFFLSFFPQLVAGPIMRADYFLPQIRENRHATRDEVYMGFWMILLGVLKKALIADYLAQYNDLIFTVDPTTGVPGYSGFETFVGIIGYMMQIYCDFSGYSDMAIGIAMIMGFSLPQNFNFPYKSRNVTDFWRRWHISLSTWLRDYVYIPLGGNRKGKARTYINNMATMLVGGLWHGAGWGYVLWGGMHGLGLAVHKASKPYLAKVPDTRTTKAIAWLVTMVFLSTTFVLFRVSSMDIPHHGAAEVAGHLNSVVIAKNIVVHALTDYQYDSVSQFFTAVQQFAAVRWIWLILLAVIVGAHALPTNFWPKAANWFVRSPWVVKLLIFIVIVQLVLQLRGEDVAPFIYFDF